MQGEWGESLLEFTHPAAYAAAGDEGRPLNEETVMWQPDGWGWRARIGLLTPHADIGPESEFQAMAPQGVSIHVARVPLGVYVPGGAIDRPIAGDAASAFAEPPLVDDAAELLAAAPLNAIAYGRSEER